MTPTTPYEPLIRAVLALLHGQTIATCMGVLSDCAVLSLDCLPPDDRLGMARDFTTAIFTATMTSIETEAGHA